MKTQFSYFLAFDTTGPSNSYSCRMESCRISIPCKAVQQSVQVNPGSCMNARKDGRTPVAARSYRSSPARPVTASPAPLRPSRAPSHSRRPGPPAPPPMRHSGSFFCPQNGGGMVRTIDDSRDHSSAGENTETAPGESCWVATVAGADCTGLRRETHAASG